MAKEKKSQEAPKEKKEKKPQKAKLILNKTIHIAAFQQYADGKKHLVSGGTYGPGTVVTPAMVKAYNAAKARVGGETPIEAFCE